ERRWRWGGGSCMLVLFVFGGAGARENLRPTTRGRPVGPNAIQHLEVFSPDVINELRTVCGGQRIGYFADEKSFEEHSWWSAHMVWGVLTEAKFLRLNQIEPDRVGYRKAIWQKAAPAVYARGLGVEWSNDPAIVLGFAQSHGIQMIAEWPGYPVPKRVRPYLSLLQQVGPFRLYAVPNVE